MVVGTCRRAPRVCVTDSQNPIVRGGGGVRAGAGEGRSKPCGLNVRGVEMSVTCMMRGDANEVRLLMRSFKVDAASRL